jgi:hypothetical protein
MIEQTFLGVNCRNFIQAFQLPVAAALSTTASQPTSTGQPLPPRSPFMAPKIVKHLDYTIKMPHLCFQPCNTLLKSSTHRQSTAAVGHSSCDDSSSCLLQPRTQQGLKRTTGCTGLELLAGNALQLVLGLYCLQAMHYSLYWACTACRQCTTACTGLVLLAGNALQLVLGLYCLQAMHYSLYWACTACRQCTTACTGLVLLAGNALQLVLGLYCLQAMHYNLYWACTACRQCTTACTGLVLLAGNALQLVLGLYCLQAMHVAQLCNPPHQHLAR